ncbi:DUF3817 domain-containing protein [Pseudomonas sp. TH49]|uniref:DUF3817 domain-containing protein n=1 Tax=Pseudomonas sp. TH49 TaxID=2796413 RepID=UPI001911A729|nr:DUF3817 domain-containing protein [Pseudomonas sp. TH49]
MNPSRPTPVEPDPTDKALHRLSCASIIETCTLASLLFIAVPLKHLAGFPAAVSWIGPIHGITLVTYLWLLSTSFANPIFTRGEILRLLFSAIIPGGGFFNIGLFKKKQVALKLGLTQ